MQTEPDPHLEEFIHQALRQLPELEAPKTLAPRVLAALQAQADRPWWQQAWWNWPLTAKAAFVAIALALVGLVGGGGWWVGHGVTNYSQQVSERMAPFSGLWQSLPSLSTLWAALLNHTNQSLLIFAVIAAGAMYLLSVGLGTMCFRLALKRA